MIARASETSLNLAASLGAARSGRAQAPDSARFPGGTVAVARIMPTTAQRHRSSPPSESAANVERLSTAPDEVFEMVEMYIPPGYDYPLILDAASRPYGPAVQASIYDGICRYLSDGGPALPGKLLLPDEAKSYIDNGQALVSNWETTSDMMLRGYQGGYDDVRAAWAQHKNCGGPDNAVVYFSCDFDEAPGQDTQVEQYLQACIDYLGVQSVGVYGSYYVCARVHTWNPGVYLWQTQAWSGGQIFDGIHLYQRNDLGYAYVNGCACDINEARKPDFGQWNLHLGGNTVSGPSSQPGTADTPIPDPGTTDGRVWDIWQQLFGVNGTRWPQLGNRTLVDAVAELLKANNIPPAS
jgi:hypothetical protein